MRGLAIAVLSTIGAAMLGLFIYLVLTDPPTNGEEDDEWPT